MRARPAPTILRANRRNDPRWWALSPEARDFYLFSVGWCEARGNGGRISNADLPELWAAYLLTRGMAV
jgi:hypothetical protein